MPSPCAKTPPTCAGAHWSSWLNISHMLLLILAYRDGIRLIEQDVRRHQAGVGEKQKKTMLSGIKPSGDLTLGSYLGPLRHWPKMIEEYDCYFFIVQPKREIFRNELK